MWTAGFGDIRGISTSGVWPIASRMSSYRPPCGAPDSCAWAWAWSAASSAAAPTRCGFGSAIDPISAPGHRREEPDLVAVRNGGRQTVEVADVLAVPADVAEPGER